MENWVQTSSLIFNLLILIIGLYLVFLKDYVSQKGKNLATKKDISEITKRVEDVKSEINEISLKKQDRFLEFKKSVLEYNYELVKWGELSIKDIALANSDPWDSNGLKIKLYNLQNQSTIVQIAFWKLFIYSNQKDEEWLNKINIELTNILPLNRLATSFLEEMCFLSTKLNLVKSNSDTTSEIYKECTSKIESFILERNKLEISTLNAIRNTAKLIRDRLQIMYEL